MTNDEQKRLDFASCQGDEEPPNTNSTGWLKKKKNQKGCDARFNKNREHLAQSRPASGWFRP